MRQIRTALFALAAIAVVFAGVAQAAELSSEPTLRVEAGMNTAAIKNISLSADGRLLATGSSDKTVRLWSLPDGKLIRTLRLPIDAGRGGKVYAVALSPDGTTVAAGGFDAADSVERQMYVYILDAASGAIRQRLGPLHDAVFGLRFSPDGRQLAAGLGGTSGIRVWRSSDWTKTGQDTNYGDAVFGMSFAGDGRLATTSLDGHVRLYNAELKLLRKVKAHAGRKPFDIAFAPDGNSIAVAYYDTAAVDVFSAPTLQQRFVVDAKGLDSGNLQSVAWSAKGGTLFAGGTYALTDGSSPILAWDSAGRGARRILPGVRDSIVALLPYGEDGVAFGGADPAFGLIDDAGKRQLFQGPVTADMRAKFGPAFTVAADGRQVRFGLEIGDAKPWLFDVNSPSFVDSPNKIGRAHV